MHDSVLPIMPNVILFRIVVQLKRKTLYSMWKSKFSNGLRMKEMGDK